MKSSAIALILMAMQTLTAQDILKPPYSKADHRIAYGKDPLQFGDLRVPPGKGPFPVVIVIHGGCWLARYDLQHIGKLAEALTKKGVATWSIEYRRVGNPGGGYPGTFEDVENGAAYLDTLAKQYPLDVSHTVAIGHSAGGQLALWLSTRRKLRGVVSLAGVTDLRAGAAEATCGDAVTRLLKGAPDDVYRKYSPIEMVPLKVPQRLIQGATDPIVPVEMGRAYEAAAKKAGDNVTLTVIPDAGHFEVITPGTTAWTAVEAAVLALLR